MNVRKMSCLLVFGTVVSFAAAFNAAANPVTVSYVEVPSQCASPANVNLTDEVGPAPTFPAAEVITVSVGPATAGDCAISGAGGDDYKVTLTNQTGYTLENVFVVADLFAWINDGCAAVGPAESGAQCLNSTDDDGDTKVNDGCPQIGTASETSGAQCDNAIDDDAADDPEFGNWDGTILGQRAKKIADTWPCFTTITFELMDVAPNASPTFASLGVNSGSALSTFSIVANPGIQCPTVSAWGLAVMAILVLTAATVVIMRRRAAVA